MGIETFERVVADLRILSKGGTLLTITIVILCPLLLLLGAFVKLVHFFRIKLDVFGVLNQVPCIIKVTREALQRINILVVRYRANLILSSLFLVLLQTNVGDFHGTLRLVLT